MGKNTILHNNNKLINVIFIILIVLGLIFIFYNNRDKFDEYKEILLNVNYFTLLIVLFFTISSIVFRSWRWYYLVLPIKEKFTFISAFRVSINALVANFTIPGKMGIPVKAILLKKTENVDMSKSLPSILGEIIIEHSSELFIAIISVIIGGHLTKLYDMLSQIIHNQGLTINIIIFLIIIPLLFGAGVIFKKKLKSIDFFHNFVETVHITRKRADYLAYSYLITLLNLLVSYYIFWLVVATLGHPEVSLTFVIFAGVITNFMGLISPFPGGIGVRELTIYGLYDIYFGLGGIAFLAMLIMRLVTYLSLLLSFLLERVISEFCISKKKQEFIVSP